MAQISVALVNADGIVVADLEAFLAECKALGMPAAAVPSAKGKRKWLVLPGTGIKSLTMAWDTDPLPKTVMAEPVTMPLPAVAPSL